MGQHKGVVCGVHRLTVGNTGLEPRLACIASAGQRHLAAGLVAGLFRFGLPGSGRGIVCCCISAAFAARVRALAIMLLRFPAVRLRPTLRLQECFAAARAVIKRRGLAGALCSLLRQLVSRQHP